MARRLIAEWMADWRERLARFRDGTGTSADFCRHEGISLVRTSPDAPKSNGKPVRCHGSLKRERILPAGRGSRDEPRRSITALVAHSNSVRSHCTIGHVTPANQRPGLEQVVFPERDRTLEKDRWECRIVRPQVGLQAGDE
jgi:hypothetical protein